MLGPSGGDPEDMIRIQRHHPERVVFTLRCRLPNGFRIIQHSGSAARLDFLQGNTEVYEPVRGGRDITPHSPSHLLTAEQEAP